MFYSVHLLSRDAQNETIHKVKIYDNLWLVVLD